MRYYEDHLLQQAPTSLSGGGFVSCKMDEREAQQTQLMDCVRYLEGFGTSFSSRGVDHAALATHLITRHVAEFSLAIA